MRWECFTLDEIFDIKPTANGIDKVKLTPGAGEYPYVTRSDMNNGVNMFVCNQEGYNLNSGNCITVGLDTQTVFYQPSDFYTGQNIQILRHERINTYTGKFLLPLLNRTLSIYGWGGNGATLTRLRRSKIFLPVDESNRPDWNFMERYMRKCERTMIEEYISRIRVNDEAGEILRLNMREWRTFYIRDIFTHIQRGKRLKNDDHIPGNIPYVSSSAMNNGVDDFVGNTEGVRIFRDCITIANSGSVGTAFYHGYEFVASDHVTALKSPNMNKYICMFIVTTLKSLHEKYSFNREINDVRINREQIMLPANDSGDPDWQFMEDYMRQTEQTLLRKYISHITAMYPEIFPANHNPA